jgi:hypothetical protein
MSLGEGDSNDIGRAYWKMVAMSGILKFDSTQDQYCAWRKKVLAAFRLADLSDVLDASTVYPSLGVQKESEEEEEENKNKKNVSSSSKSVSDDSETKNERIQQRRKQLVYTLLLELLDDKLIKAVDSVPDGDCVGLMRKLNNKFDPISSTTPFQLKAELYQLRMGENESIDDFANRIENIVNDINRFGNNNVVSDVDKQCALLTGINQKFREYTRQIISTDNTKTFNDIIIQLRNYELVNKVESSTKSGRLGSIQINGSINSAEVKTNGKCYICSSEKHYVQECPYNLKSSNGKQGNNGDNEKIYCHICRRSNHSTESCRFNVFSSKKKIPNKSKEADDFDEVASSVIVVPEALS